MCVREKAHRRKESRAERVEGRNLGELRLCYSEGCWYHRVTKEITTQLLGSLLVSSLSLKWPGSNLPFNILLHGVILCGTNPHRLLPRLPSTVERTRPCVAWLSLLPASFTRGFLLLSWMGTFPGEPGEEAHNVLTKSFISIWLVYN
jgi:hypothetical protein